MLKREDKQFLKIVGYGLLGGGAVAITGGALTLVYWTRKKSADEDVPTDESLALGIPLIVVGSLAVFASASVLPIGFLAKELKK
jgi:hypothetical protein